MEPEIPALSDNQGWQQALNPSLTQRLIRPLVRPGVIRPQLGRTILRRMQHTGTPMPLLQRVLRHGQNVEDGGATRVPMVYARRVQANDAAVSTAALQQTMPATPRPLVQPLQRAESSARSVALPEVQRAAQVATRPVVQTARRLQAEQAVVANATEKGTSAPAQRFSDPADTPAAARSFDRVLPSTPVLPTVESSPVVNVPLMNEVVLPAGRRLRRASAPTTGAQEGAQAQPAGEQIPLVQRTPDRESPSGSNDSPVTPTMAGQTPESLPTMPTVRPQAGSMGTPAFVQRQADPTGSVSFGQRPGRITESPTQSTFSLVNEQLKPGETPVLPPLTGAPLPTVTPLHQRAASQSSNTAGGALPQRPIIAANGAAANNSASMNGATPRVVAPIQRTSRADAPTIRLARTTAAPRTAVASESSVSGSSAAGTPTLQMQAAGAATMQERPPVELPTATASTPPASADVTHVAEQVYSLLVQRLASEREGRGW